MGLAMRCALFTMNGPDDVVRRPEPGTNPVGARFIAPKPVAPNPVAPKPIEASTGFMPDQGAINRAPTLGAIVRQFKARSTHAINTRHNTRGRPIWQRNYWERIIRSEDEYRALCAYIRENPAQWALDSLYSDR